MSPTPSVPSAGGRGDFSQRIAAERARLSGRQEAAQGAAQRAREQAGTQAAAGRSQAGESEEQVQDQGTGPVGQGDYVIRPGDCVSKIAKETGHFWATIWEDPANAELRSVRQDPNVLMPQDRVTVPDLREKAEDCATEQRHRFRRRGEPARLRLQFMRGEEPRADEDYQIVVDGEIHTGQTDDEGQVEVPIPGNACGGKILIGSGDDQDEFQLQLGHLAPATEVEGVQARLNNLSYDCGNVDGELGPKTKSALARFQHDHQLPETGRPDQETRDKLKEVHGS